MPFGQSVGQGFVNPSILIAEILKIIGAKGRILVYSPSEGLGNLVLAVSGQATTDPSGNIILAGLTVGNVNSGNYTYVNLTGQIMLFNGGVATISLDPAAQTITMQTPARLKFPSGDSMEAIAANIAAGVVGAGPTRFLQALISGPKGNLAGFQDWTQIEFNSANDNSTSQATMVFNYIGTGGTPHPYAFIDPTGFNILAGTIVAAHPGAIPLVAESWQTLALVNGYTSGVNPGGFLDVPQIRMMADNQNFQFKGSLTTPNPAATGVFSAVPAGYPNANLGGNYGEMLVANYSGGTVDHAQVQNNGNLSLNNLHNNITFNLSGIMPTQ